MLELLQQDFVHNAWLAGTIVAIVTASVGYFVILRAQAFAGDALTDMGFAGATAAAVLGINAFVGMLIMTVLSAFGLGALGERVRGRDVETGMVLSFGLGLGVLFLSLTPQQGNADTRTGTGLLFGSLLSVSRAEVWSALSCGIVVLAVLACLFRPLLFASLDPVVARSRGVPVRLLSIVFLVLVGITTAESVLVVGVLLVTALLVAPAATAQHLVHRPRTALLFSVLLSLMCTWGGLLLALLGSAQHLPVSFCITALAGGSYLLALPLGKRRPLRRAGSAEPRHERAGEGEPEQARAVWEKRVTHVQQELAHLTQTTTQLQEAVTTLREQQHAQDLRQFCQQITTRLHATEAQCAALAAQHQCSDLALHALEEALSQVLDLQQQTEPMGRKTSTVAAPAPADDLTVHLARLQACEEVDQKRQELILMQVEEVKIMARQVLLRLDQQQETLEDVLHALHEERAARFALERQVRALSAVPPRPARGT